MAALAARGLVVVGVASALAACGVLSDPEPGTMTSGQYRSLASQESTLTLEDARERGVAQTAELEERWLSEGGAEAEARTDCWYAEVTYRTRYRGTARFCFDDRGRAVSVERNRADLE